MIATKIRPAAAEVSRGGEPIMKAAVRHRYGAPDVVQLEEVTRPVAREGEVLVRVRAAGVARGVWHLMTGQPYLMRIAGFGLRAPKNPALGMDLAGVVESVGANVSRFHPGDEVFGIATGTFAEYAVAREDKLAPKPANLTCEQAAGLPVSGLTALQAVRDHAHVKAGQKVLIVGASGGVGTIAVQIAMAFGAHVTGVCSTAKLEMVRSLGAHRVVDYTREDFAAEAQRYDAILDIGGNSSLARLRSALARKGTLVIVGGEGGGRWFGIGRQLQAMMVSPFVGQKLTTFICSENHQDLITLGELVERGKLVPVVDRTYALAETADAIKYMVEGRARGRVVITV